MRYLIMLEQTEAGFAVQVPDLAIVTYGETIEAAKQAAVAAIQINREAQMQHARGLFVALGMTSPIATPRHWARTVATSTVGVLPHARGARQEDRHGAHI
ncbi:MAG: hypothetical protein HY268_28240 [Deltaproteobacteria bacterium]|nr:hypothetical protein [Deltaproteobacteria bacterium]